ncbi:MAG: S41 family peptidase [Flavobacteriia bacterium]|nr:S41 family peptidase [Flavobacteriia bacterium]
MKHNPTKYWLPFALSVCIVLGLMLGHLLTPKRKGFVFQNEEEKYAKFKDIIELLNTKYVDNVDGDKLFEETISDMLHKLDPHSNYIPASDLNSLNEGIEGKFGGIGVRFAIIRDTICVTNVLKNSPSLKAGLKSGDKIISVNGKDLSKLKIDNEKVMKLLKGKENTKVLVQVYRNNKKINKEIIRGSIPIETVVCSTMLSKNLAYLKLDQFSLSTAQEFNSAVQKLKSEGMKKLILDLRNNGGGVLQAAVNIVDEFLSSNLPIVKTKGKNTDENVYKSTSKGQLEDIEVVVLINSNSASASEIVAGALQDNDRATIMGRRSFGKGLVQEDLLLKDGSNLRLTVARYYTPTGRCIQKPYSKNFEDYYNDQFQRIENGENYHIDSSLLVDSLKYITPKGKVVYGGGGIMPDIFIPIDTLGMSNYFREIRYFPVFSNFSFDYIYKDKKKWKNVYEFNSQFVVSDNLALQLAHYAEDNFKIPLIEKDFEKSKNLIKQTLKAEIARQLWMEQGYYTVMSKYDKEIIKAIIFLSK